VIRRLSGRKLVARGQVASAAPQPAE